MFRCNCDSNMPLDGTLWLSSMSFCFDISRSFLVAWNYKSLSYKDFEIFILIVLNTMYLINPMIKYTHTEIYSFNKLLLFEKQD